MELSMLLLCYVIKRQRVNRTIVGKRLGWMHFGVFKHRHNCFLILPFYFHLMCFSLIQITLYVNFWKLLQFLQRGFETNEAESNHRKPIAHTIKWLFYCAFSTLAAFEQNFVQYIFYSLFLLLHQTLHAFQGNQLVSLAKMKDGQHLSLVWRYRRPAIATSYNLVLSLVGEAWREGGTVKLPLPGKAAAQTAAAAASRVQLKPEPIRPTVTCVACAMGIALHPSETITRAMGGRNGLDWRRSRRRKDSNTYLRWDAIVFLLVCVLSVCVVVGAPPPRCGLFWEQRQH